ncbi:MYPU_1760 family metalloprotease [Mycoplasmopsis gallinarum]|uniref:MYPU_1760 family metalloprotease n=1 Tax=Mycoplasmopsis gallinarum TaxID=29557 RepID=UPI0004852000|nr:hypothetical protein [Mycoplasmopsis gallinarum]
MKLIKYKNLQKKLKYQSLCFLPIIPFATISPSCIFWDSKEINDSGIQLVRESDNYNLDSLILNKYKVELPGYIFQNEIEIDKVNWLDDSLFNLEIIDNQNVLVYHDPVNGIIFRDFSYGEITNNETGKKENRFLLGKTGLALLAKMFYNKMTFGSEIAYLDSININNFSIIDNSSLGLYIPSIKQIHLNGGFVAEFGFSLEQKVIYLMSSLYHEYMHHWANSYVNYGNYIDSQSRKNLFTQVKYRTPDGLSEKPSIKTNKYFYSDFYNKFKFYLNYQGGTDINKSAVATNPYFIGKYFTIGEIFDLANTTDDALFEELFLKLKNHSNPANDKISFNPYSENNNLMNIFGSLFGKQRNTKNENITTDYDFSNLSYYYSMVELIPREWIKYNYLSDYSPSNSTNKILWTISNDEEKYKISQNYLGTFKQSAYYSQYINNSYVSDWSRSLINATPFIGYNGLSSEQKREIIFSNNVWLDKVQFTENTQVPTYKLFYKLFLDTMGYGKVISQMKNYANNSYNNFQSDENKVSLTGYLDNKYDALLIYEPVENEKRNLKKVNLNYLNYVRFEGKNHPEDREYKLKPKDVLDDLSAKQYVYYSDYFNINKSLNSEIAFWKDLNQDNEIQWETEVKSTFDSTALPQRPIINSDSEQFDRPKYYRIYNENENGNYKLKIRSN